MKPNVVVSAFAGLFAVVAIARAAEITVGDKQLTIPEPDGFAQVTPQMQPYFEYIERGVMQGNALLAFFISEESVAEAAAGKVPPVQRRFAVQTTLPLQSAFVTKLQFEQIASDTIQTTSSLIQDVKKTMPQLLEDFHMRLSQGKDVEEQLSMLGIVPLDPHVNKDRVFSFSTMMAINTTDEEQGPSIQFNSNTTSIVHVRGKVLFLYCWAPLEELEWTQSQSEEWVAAVLAANPANESEIAREQTTGFDYRAVLRSALIGAVIGGIAGGLIYGVRKVTT